MLRAPSQPSAPLSFPSSPTFHLLLHLIALEQIKDNDSPVAKSTRVFSFFSLTTSKAPAGCGPPPNATSAFLLQPSFLGPLPPLQPFAASTMRFDEVPVSFWLLLYIKGLGALIYDHAGVASGLKSLNIPPFPPSALGVGLTPMAHSPSVRPFLALAKER